jgi:hypothetical protein
VSRPIAALGTLILTLAAAPVLLTISCGLRPGRKETEATLYFPTRVGSIRIYRGDLFGGCEWAEVVTAVEEKDGQHLVTVAATKVGEMVDANTERQRYVVSREGVFHQAYYWPIEHTEWKEITPPNCLLKLPYSPGNRWHRTMNWFREPDDPEQKLNLITGGIEEVRVPAGTFRAIRVDGVGDYLGKHCQLTVWYAPGVGTVRSRTNDRGAVWTAELYSFTPGKD